MTINKKDRGVVVLPITASRAPKNAADRVVILRFRFGKSPKLQTGYGVVSREWARQLCSQPDTKGKDWFLGFDSAERW